jgi:hypothetical protein
MNDDHVFIIGGRQKNPMLLDKEYDVPRSCLSLNIRNGVIREKTFMQKGRSYFGICNIGQSIYIFGGRDED